MRITQRMMVDNLRENLSASAENLATLQDQLSSSKRLRKPSDDPAALNRALTLKSSSGRNDQYLRNISASRAWFEATDSALNHLSKVLAQARDIALRGQSNVLSADERQSLAAQVDSLLEEAAQTVSTTQDNKYIFSGRAVTTTPFLVTRTSSQITGMTYQGESSGEMGIDIGGDVTLSVNIPGDAEVGGVAILPQALGALISVRDELNSGSGVVSETSLNELSNSMNGIATLQGTVGTRVKRIDATEGALNELQINMAVLLSREQDADAAQVMTKLMMQETVYQAALAAGARAIQPSLLDFLK